MLKLIGAVLIVVSLAAASVAAYAISRPTSLTLMSMDLGWRNDTGLGHDNSSLIFVQMTRLMRPHSRGLYTYRLYVKVWRGVGGLISTNPSLMLNSSGGPRYAMLLPPKGARLEVYAVDQQTAAQLDRLLTPSGLIPSSELEASLKLLRTRSIASKSTAINWHGTSIALSFPSQAAGAVIVIRIPLSGTAMYVVRGGIAVVTQSGGTTTTTITVTPGSQAGKLLVGDKLAEEMDKALQGSSIYTRSIFMEDFTLGVRGRMELRSELSPGTLGLLRSISLGIAGLLIMLFDAARNPDSYEGRWRVFRLLAEKLGIASSSEQQ